MQKARWPFDVESALRINTARIELLNRLLSKLTTTLDLRTALDSGCGIGVFSDHLASLGMKVVAFDARPQNIAEAKKRHPTLEFYVRDVEDPTIVKLGSFDLVLGKSLSSNSQSTCPHQKGTHR